MLSSFLSFCALLPVLSLAAGNPRLGFAIGTTSKLQDIVKDGVTQAPYNSGFNPPAVQLSTFQFNWVVHLNQSTLMGPSFQVYNTSFELSAGGTYFDVSSVGGDNQTIAVGGFPDFVELFFSCKQFGTETVKVVVNVAPYDPIEFFLQHLCQKDHVISAALEAYDVGTTAAILDGQPNEHFVYDAPPGAYFTQFYVWTSSMELSPSWQYTVTTEYDPSYNMTVEWVSTNNGLAYYEHDTIHPTSTFTLIYKCPSKQVFIPVLVRVWTGWHTSINFQITKNCDPQHALTRMGLMIGDEKNGTEVAFNGLATQKYNRSTPYLYSAGDITDMFYLWLDPQYSPDNQIQNYEVQIITNTDALAVTGTGFKGVLRTPTQGPEHDAVLVLDYVCQYALDNVNFTVMLIMDAWRPISMHFVKSCVDPELDVGQMDSQSMYVPSIVHHNVVLPNITEVSPDHESTNFYVWIGEAFSQVSPYQQFALVSYHFDYTYMDSVVVLSGDKAHTSHNAKGTPFIKVTYQCVRSGRGNLNFTLSFGWQSDLTFTIVKHCDMQEPQGGGSSTSAWSPFGIFAFTVFILILVWCLVGCGYNYVAKDQRGADAIPGITLYRSIYHRCFPAPKYTPQTDYNYSERESPDYGGTSYQSENL